MKQVYVGFEDPGKQALIRSAMDARSDLQLTFFSDGLLLYRQIQEQPPDLLFLEMVLPSLAGLTLLRLLKLHEEQRKIPVIFVASAPDESTRKLVEKSGADALLQTPFRADEALGILGRFLEGKI